MSEIVDNCGLFGKTPQQADFVSHFLSDDFTEYWHSWLQSSLSVSREQLGDAWLDYYLTSPVWRFALMPGVASPHAVCGVMIPSVDEVGRYFPLTIAHQGACAPWAAYLDGQEWYQTVAKLALTALDEQTSYTQLIKQLEALPCPAFSAAPEYSTQTVTMNAHANQAFTSTPADTPQQLANNVLHKAYTGLLGNYSLWWTEGSEHVESSLLLSANLPEAGQFAAMLDGDWRQWNWAKEDIINHDNP